MGLFFFLPDLLFIYSFLAALHPHCCVQTFSSCSEWGLLFAVVWGLLVAEASLVAEHGLQASGPCTCGAWALLLCGMSGLPGPGIKPVCPPLAGGFLTTGPPGKSLEKFVNTLLIRGFL